MAKIGLPKGSGKRLKVREKSVKSQGISKMDIEWQPCSFLAHQIGISAVFAYVRQFHLTYHIPILGKD